MSEKHEHKAQNEQKHDEHEHVRGESCNHDHEHTPQKPTAETTQVEKLQAAITDLTNLIRQERADFENYRKRIEANAATDKQKSNQHLIKQIIPVLDSLDLSLKHKENPAECLIGVEGVLHMLKGVLSDAGVEIIDVKHQIFDPTLSQAIGTRVDPKQKENTIVEVAQPAIKLAGVIIRHAKVIISRKEEQKA